MNASKEQSLRANAAQWGVIAASFSIAFCIQVVIHEMGHCLAGYAVGATGAQVRLHPFLNANVMFTHVPEGMAQPIIGMMGITADLMLASIAGLLVWKRQAVVWLPVLLWGAIAFIGEGVGMLESLGTYPEYRDDITQWIPLGLPPAWIAATSVLLVLLGLVWLALILPTAGLSAQAPFLQLLPAYFFSLPFYFLMAIAYLLLVHPDKHGTLSVRLSQMAISLVFTLLLALFHKPIPRLSKRFVRPRRQNRPDLRDAIPLGVAAIVVLILLIGTTTVSWGTL